MEAPKHMIGSGFSGKGYVPASRLSIESIPRALLLSAWSWVALPAGAADDLATWAHSQNIYYDTSPTGADVTGPVGNFPVLLRLRAGNFPFAEAMRGGQDLRFAKPDGAPLSYEIERWDSAGAKADVWVRIDTVAGNFQGVLARMYWGKAGAASLSDGNAVFNSSMGYEYVWHLGGAGTASRPNAVATRPAAVTANYDGDESTEGVAGLCDSLDGKAAGDYLDIGDGYVEFSGGMSISMWAYPTRASVWGRLMDLGNGAGLDNIMWTRRSNSQDLVFTLYVPQSQKVGELAAPGALALDQWQYFALTVAGQTVSMYRNGSLVASGTLSAPVTNTRRVSNYLGRSNWADEYFAGKLDQVEMGRTARSANWFKLAYANQKPDQNLIAFSTPSACIPKFAAPADTSLPEGSSLDLAGVADCATSYQWSVLAGPAPRILDPEVKVLQISLPRVLSDTLLLYRFSAVVTGASRTRDVLVRVRETIPEPGFSLSAATWNGKDSLVMKPVIANLASIQACSEPSLYYEWTLSGTADTVWRKDGLVLRSAPAGTLGVGLCLHNNGPKVCHTANVQVGPPTSIGSDAGTLAPAGSKGRRDARGRALPRVRSQPGFPARAR
jgi:hypothetical protein